MVAEWSKPAGKRIAVKIADAFLERCYMGVAIMACK